MCWKCRFLPPTPNFTKPPGQFWCLLKLENHRSGFYTVWQGDLLSFMGSTGSLFYLSDVSSFKTVSSLVMASVDWGVIVQGALLWNCCLLLFYSLPPSIGSEIYLLKANRDFWVSLLEILVKWDEDGESLISESCPSDFHAQPRIGKTALEEQRTECSLNFL